MTHHLLNQAQQQLQQPHQLLLQRLLNQQNVNPSLSFPMSVCTSAPFLAGHPHQSQSATNDLLLNLQQQSSQPPLNALLLSNVLSHLQHQPSSSNAGISTAPQPTQSQHTDQLQRSVMLHQNQPLASASDACSINHQQLQLQPLDLRLQQTLQTTLQQFQQHFQGPPPSPLNSTGMDSANVPSPSTRQEDSEEEEQSEPEDDSDGD
mmetsp:Transcript_15710/g.24408  ORF Transcript_15710/g.24408 Transcript_15710/m.24408 type:complete len:206 (-) Transcript_15710:221-838(-)